ncbi:MAG: carboxypeptidase regulatory-like domain-containing protein, partial [Chloroflexota bacterium]|nr:carboxypeptidase regulatory-like domain-containing protein [Chloroflexota bacterium]
MTNSLAKGGVAGVAITVDPAVAGVTIATDSSGAYAATLPVGAYTLTIKKAGFGDATAPASIAAGVKTTKDVALKPTAVVAVSAGAAQTGAPGAAVPLKGTADVFDGSTGATYAWTQTKGAKATISGGATLTPTVTLANAAAYKDALVAGMKEVLDRATVVGIDPHMLGAAELSTFKLEVTTSSGAYSSTVNVTTDLPYAVSTSLADVPVGVPVLVQGKKLDTYAWTIAGPSGAKATLDSATGRFPSFTPDVVGKYTLTEAKGAKVDVYAGTWAGAISGIDGKGLPLSASCTVCHNGTIAADKFTAWKASGHAEIFTNNLNTSATYSASCFTCHSVGFDTSVKNGGFDDASDYQAFLDAKVMGKPSPTNWATVVSKFPNAARLANIQCESCHGPNNDAGTHATKPAGAADNTPRVSLSSSVCATCHGEPLRHGRYQQWELSGHANFELAIAESTSSSCARCHTAQGFLAWIKQPDLTKNLQGKSGNATADELKALGLTPEMVQPQTCAVCHDP